MGGFVTYDAKCRNTRGCGGASWWLTVLLVAMYMQTEVCPRIRLISAACKTNSSKQAHRQTYWKNS